MSPPADTAALASTSGAPLAPLVAAQLNFVLSQANLPIRVGQIWSGCRDGRYADRFTLAIPFCLDYVYWDFLYNALSPKVAPDVVFGPDDEGFQPLVDFDETGSGEKSCLANWDCRDTSALLSLIKELREFYIEYQKKRAAEVDDARLKFEISTVLSKEGIEVCTVSSNGRPDEVKFAVPLLDLDLAKLVPGCPWKLPQKIHLQAVFPISRSYSSVPSAPRLKLVSTPDLKSFFSVDDVKLPPWLDGMCMAEYLPNLEENLKIQVVEASASIGSRRRFIEALAPTFGRPLEADPIFCRKATILSISGIFTFLVHFVIPLQFPKHQPVLTLESSQHFNAQGLPIMSAPVNDYPWSPRWDPTEMVERIYDFLVDECQTFKKFCSDSIPQQK
ncbi:uncharacterized protein [Oryza sativa Japonica Group]|uniref:BRISC and BRCA1-A complex member 2 n=3 Tax=Oryza TaxID=4527 RepID=A0A0P0X0Z6_ORYSJ|nr:BRISC and BRCA1-A complex member 2 [Oryza sativa Japonica Group]XP_052159218.1 uncharacterized protein LOC127776730 [Oryza glaberrima]XP_052159219.1 uncharacterized protein LOC127776730 [Oryza glaberrima]KAB8103882.1 hypothetical protein EE612_036484 [Oryza sativa]EEE66359.1 hypothetical protein OsJ_22662 [Oryza sativa Japonica Group]KAF2928501.1 hypothetical protein DAI22_06g283000 [Oryza sativa Japonica Group]BAD53578.1 putative brain and reproductive organ-expressed protein [Oryza sativ|eukprot:NP_001058586.1 Os06g0715600 [Oryza sativa Japonica Group]